MGASSSHAAVEDRSRTPRRGGQTEMQAYRVTVSLVVALAARAVSACGGELAPEAGGDASGARTDGNVGGATADDATAGNSSEASSGVSSSGSSPGSSSSGASSGQEGRCSATCKGCCDANGVCNTGVSDNACGSGGAPCADCTQSQLMCVNQISRTNILVTVVTGSNLTADHHDPQDQMSMSRDPRGHYRQRRAGWRPCERSGFGAMPTRCNSSRRRGPTGPDDR